MKRSNRLVLLVGVFLAVIAFVGVIILSQGGPGETGEPETPTVASVVVATQDIPLGTVIDGTMVETTEVDIDGAETDAYVDASQVIGQIARQEVLAGGQITARTTSGGTGTVANLRVPAGMRAMTVEVDEVTGVGTIIQPGDYVDMVVRIKINPEPGVAPDNVWDTSSKIVLQGMQVLGVQLPPVTPAAEGEQAADPGTGISGRHELVTLAVTAAQVEVIKWVQNPDINPGWPTADPSISLVLRSPEDFIDEDGNPRLPESPCVTAPIPTAAPGSPAPSPSPGQSEYRGCETTDGVVLSGLIQSYGVLYPTLENAEWVVTLVPDILQVLQALEESGFNTGLPEAPTPSP